MALSLWVANGQEWLDAEKVNFNGNNREITVNAGVTALDIRDDVYSAWVRWAERDDNERYYFAMRFTGLDPIPGGQTGDTYFLINNWKLIYDPRLVAITGILYSDNYPSPYFFTDGSQVYPATVSALGIKSQVTIDYSQLAAAVAQQFAEPEMTTAGIAAAVGTVDVDSAEIADEVAGRFTFGSDGRVAADIAGSLSEKDIKRTVAASIPSPAAPSTIWDAAPRWMKKPVKTKDYSDAIRTLNNKLDGLYQSLQAVQQAPQPLTAQAFDATGIEREIQNLSQAISAIQMPDGSENIASLRGMVEPLQSRMDDLKSAVLGVKQDVGALPGLIPTPDLSAIATKREMSALQSLLGKLSNYDDSTVKQMLESVISSVEAIPDETEVISKKVDLVLDNQMRLL